MRHNTAASTLCVPAADNQFSRSLTFQTRHRTSLRVRSLAKLLQGPPPLVDWKIWYPSVFIVNGQPVTTMCWPRPFQHCRSGRHCRNTDNSSPLCCWPRTRQRGRSGTRDVGERGCWGLGLLGGTRVIRETLEPPGWSNFLCDGNRRFFPRDVHAVHCTHCF